MEKEAGHHILTGLLHFGVRCGARTPDNQNHNLVLYQLN